MKAASHERWVWIELIGFDNTESDFGVANYLDTVGFIPQSISLLFYTPDFVHAHEGMEREWILPMEVCSYGARPYGKERNRQEWTNFQLRSLVAELQKHGVEMYCSFFDIYQFHVGETLRASKWCAAHPELYEMRKTGEAFSAINPLRRFKDGSYYEDLFVSDLIRVMLDYGFDGYHGADGYTSPRLSLAETDYSDDMVDQFVTHSGVELGTGLTANCDGDPFEMEKRADWIWNHKRLEWIQFHGIRWAQLWHKIMPALRKERKKAVINTAWTRDPFEALYRYGVDYRLLADTGVDGFVVESVGASLSAGAGETEYEPGSEFMAMLLAIKAYVPNKKLICLNAIQDTNEQWDALSHAPTVLERDIYSLSNLYLQDRTGLSRCASGFMACLGDGISRDGWNWISKRWNSGFDGCPGQIVGASMVWSDQLLHHSLEDYAVTRNWHVHKYMNELIARGAPLHKVVNIKDIQETNGSILVTHLHLLQGDELQSVLAYRGGPAILIGNMTDRISGIGAVAGWGVVCEVNQLFCVIRDRFGEVAQAFVMEKNADDEVLEQNQLAAANDDISWIDSLYFSPVTEQFLSTCVQGMKDHTNAPKVLRNVDFIRTAALEMAPNRWRIMITNLHMNYKSAHLDVGRTIKNINVLTDFPGIPVTPNGSQFSLYVPGRGIVMVELQFQEEL
ncbi:hypothetical protein Back11_02090 [Paenibacillus baekrokdamisoli]|uniref:Uncharacterized protein n=1 Tax=Paenibacillus baekrokdamisoli TaxID=1712516 RepID=A0A3G9J675_9BACL|nr:hypothetical protein [Paenibacillus baekrokdamisoli]MBB3069161.1 hypothetical protein [Paenibacillus baekrokdamisoli]BBH18864.1 hypothetical protein Back11_02090 [Paenibacillus baekrokdamisoli]